MLQPAPASRRSNALARLLALTCAASLGTALSCAKGSTGPSGPAGPPGPPDIDPTPTDVAPDEDAPAIVVEITGLSGAVAASGNFAAGDSLSVNFTLEQEDGSPWGVAEMSSGRIQISGPTFNYQRVLPERDDVLALSVHKVDGSWTYTFPVALPAVYAAPYNDSESFQAGDGELKGQALLPGTYTLGLSFAWSYEVGLDSFLQVGEVTRDFLLGEGAGALAPRQVSKLENCNQCHVELRAHDGRYRDLTLCLLCHTSGAEDSNDPSVADGTPGVSIESRQLFHRIHNGAHLPSVLGIGVKADGTRDYDVARKPHQVLDSAGVLHDYSQVGHPVWPYRTIAMPVNSGFSSLPAAAQAKEMGLRTGLAACHVCHFDPDGAGPLTAPTDGKLIYAQPTRRACGACHDDWDWSKPYIDSLGSMEPQPDDSLCIQCHDPIKGGVLAVEASHTHPLRDPLFNPGVKIELLGVAEPPPGGGAVEPGDKLAITFNLRDEAGNEFLPEMLDRLRASVSGPTQNGQLLLLTDIPTALLTGPQPYTLTLPQERGLELVGHAQGNIGETFTTLLHPHVDVAGAQTSVRVRSGTGTGFSFLAAAAVQGQNYVDVLNPAGFERDDYLVLAEGFPGAEHYLQVQAVEGTRLWFSSPATPAYPAGLALALPQFTPVQEVLLALKSDGPDYTLDAAQGVITANTDLGAGNAVLLSYTADWSLPAKIPLALNDSPDLDETSGKWFGKSTIPGTYTASVWAWYEKDLPQFFPTQHNLYRIASPPATLEFQVGTAGPPAPYTLIPSGQACNACHQDLMFHGGGERGFETCLACHGTAGAEDRPTYVAANAPATTGVTVSLRTLLHQIHRGQELANAASFSVAGEGPLPWPDNYSVNSFANILFPAMPGATRNCAKCHGADNGSPLYPSDRDHPVEQGAPVLAWKAICGACHDSSPALAHMLANTPTGLESCAVCHGPGKVEDVTLRHKPR